MNDIDIAGEAGSVLRDYNTPGDPNSGAYSIVKAQMRQLMSDVMANLAGAWGVVAAIANAPAGSEAYGTIYIVGTDPTGDFAGQANAIAVFTDTDSTDNASNAGGWLFSAPDVGRAVWVQALNLWYDYTAEGWAAQGNNSGYVGAETLAALYTLDGTAAYAKGTVAQIFGDVVSFTAGTGGVSSTTLTVAAVASGTLAPGQTVSWASSADTIATDGTGSGGTGTYNLANAATIATGTAMTATGDGTWIKSGSGNGSGNWTQVSALTLQQLNALIAANTASIATMTAEFPATASEPRFGAAFVDSSSNIALQFDTQRIYHKQFNKVATQAAQGSYNVALPPRDPAQAGVALIMPRFGVYSYGQSLSEGVHADLCNTLGIGEADMFIGGARPQDGGTNPAVIYASLTDLVETLGTSGGANAGETPLSGFVSMLMQMLQLENGADMAAMGLRPLMSAPGEGGLQISTLEDTGYIYYQRLVANAQYGKSLTSAYQAACIIMEQGQADYSDGTSQATWYATAKTLLQNFTTAQETYTGIAPAKSVPLIMAQTCAGPLNGGATPTIALAQMELAADNTVAAACPFPDYFFPKYPVDNQHLTRYSSPWMGAYFARAFKRWCIDGAYPAGLTMSTPIRISATEFIVPFNLPFGAKRLVIDTSNPDLPDPGDLGFTIDDAGSPIALASTPVLALNGTGLYVKAASAVPTGNVAALQAGYIGDAIKWYTCLRTDTGDRLKFRPVGLGAGLALPMHDWCMIHSVTLP